MVGGRDISRHRKSSPVMQIVLIVRAGIVWGISPVVPRLTGCQNGSDMGRKLPEN